MKIQAYMPVYNESDILPFSLRYLLTQGISIHALEGWSTDNSWEILTSTPGVTAERFPPSGADTQQRCRAILRRIETLASQSDADWCLLNDSDEWRYSPVSQETLADGIARADADGWNAIDHKVFVFLPIDDSYIGGDPTQHFRYYTDDPKLDMLCRIPQVKLWKNLGRVDLAASGGHDVRFAGRCLCPERFVLRHYPFRTGAQAKRKLSTRLERRCHIEHKDGWGVHYDTFAPGFDFLWGRGQLKPWNDLTKPLPQL